MRATEALKSASSRDSASRADELDVVEPAHRGLDRGLDRGDGVIEIAAGAHADGAREGEAHQVRVDVAGLAAPPARERAGGAAGADGGVGAEVIGAQGGLHDAALAQPGVLVAHREAAAPERGREDVVDLAEVLGEGAVVDQDLLGDRGRAREEDAIVDRDEITVGAEQVIGGGERIDEGADPVREAGQRSEAAQRVRRGGGLGPLAPEGEITVDGVVRQHGAPIGIVVEKRRRGRERWMARPRPLGSCAPRSAEREGDALTEGRGPTRRQRGAP
ncbi:MAG: hypothetical protein QM820_30690 [Minicystis sp.]